MEQAVEPEEIFAAAAELKKLGLNCTILLTDENGEKLFPRYLSFGKSVVAAAEKLTGLSAADLTIDIKKVDIFKEVIWERKTIFVESAEESTRQILPKSIRDLASQIVKIFRIKNIIDAPLIVEDEVIGLLSVQSDDLTENDNPAITAFAHQMAAAWRKAQLYEQAQSEIAERNRVEQALRENQARMNSIIRAAPVAIGLVQDRVFAWVSEQLVEDIVARLEEYLLPNLSENILEGFHRTPLDLKSESISTTSGVDQSADPSSRTNCSISSAMKEWPIAVSRVALVMFPRRRLETETSITSMCKSTIL